MKKKYKMTMVIIFEDESDIPDTHSSGATPEECFKQLDDVLDHIDRSVDEGDIKEMSVTIHQVP